MHAVEDFKKFHTPVSISPSFSDKSLLIIFKFLSTSYDILHLLEKKVSRCRIQSSWLNVIGLPLAMISINYVNMFQSYKDIEHRVRSSPCCF